MRVHNNILGHRQNLKNSSMDIIDTQDTQRERSGRDLLTMTQQNKRQNTYTQQNFTTHVEETMPIGV